MVVDQKIVEAEYFLDKIKNAIKREDFIPNLSAFLSSARSIADYLLEDYNLKFGLQISLNDKLYPHTFEDIARQKNSRNALAFIYFYNTEFDKVKQDQICALLLIKRNIKVHRTDVSLQASFSVPLTDTIDIHDSVSVEVRDKYGNLKMRSSSRNDKVINSEDKNREDNRIGNRGLESRLIGTIAHCYLCNASENWLGKYSPIPEIANGKLWLKQHLGSAGINDVDKMLISGIMA